MDAKAKVSSEGKLQKGVVLGVIGVGTIGKACIIGWAKAGIFEKIICSPRGRANVAELESKYDQVTKVESNQQVLDQSKLVVVAVLPTQVESILRELKFTKEHKLITLVSMVSTPSILSLVKPCIQVARAVPLPCVQNHRGVAIVSPKNEPFTREVEEIFSSIGGCVAATDDAQCALLQSATALMGPYYQMLASCTEWLSKHGVPKQDGMKFLAGMFQGVADDAMYAVESGRTFEDLVEEQTPGGLNEMCVKILEEKGVFGEFHKCLEASHDRLVGKKKQ